MAYEWAKPGAKVVCVRGYTAVHPSPVMEGKIYTIAEVDSQYWAGFPAITVQELPPFKTGPWWNLDRFRPLITKTQEQDVEMFLRLASPSPLERLDLLAERMNELAED